MLSIGTLYLNKVMCSSARLVTRPTVNRPRPSLQALLVRFCSCNYTISKWEGKHMHHCACVSKHHSKSISQPFNKNLLFSQSSRLTLIFRTYSVKTSSQREDKLRVKDCVPSGYELIYKAPMEWYVFLAQGISTFSLLLLCVGGIYTTVQGNAEFVSMATKIGDMVDNKEQLLIMAVALAITSIAIRMLVSNYPLRIYHRNGSYISIFTPQIPLQTKTLVFKKGDVKHLESKGIFAILPWKDTKYTIGKKEVILLDDFFRKPADFHTMIETDSM